MRAFFFFVEVTDSEFKSLFVPNTLNLEKFPQNSHGDDVNSAKTTEAEIEAMEGLKRFEMHAL